MKIIDGNITLIVDYENTGHQEIVKVFGSVKDIVLFGVSTKIVEFRTPDSKFKYVRGHATGKKHIELRDAVNTKVIRKEPIYISIDGDKGKTKKGKDKGEYERETTEYSILDYSLDAEFI